MQQFCGSIYTYSFIYKINPLIAYLHLLNPALFAVEAMRAAVLGQKEYLNFWICSSAIISLTIVFGYDAIRRFKKRIDFI
jgi:ABC-type polysaccharide/polyol phosphate export permease